MGSNQCSSRAATGQTLVPGAPKIVYTTQTPVLDYGNSGPGLYNTQMPVYIKALSKC